MYSGRRPLATQSTAIAAIGTVPGVHTKGANNCGYLKH
jgi:hypothetical protein